MQTTNKLKLIISHLISNGVCESQKDLGEKLGYASQFSFSTSVNKRPNAVIPKLKSFYPTLNLDYLFGDSEQMFLTEEELSKEKSERNKVDYYNKVTDIFTALKFPNWKQFCRTLDYANEQLYYDLKAGKAKKLPEDFVAAVCKKYPHVNPDYLLKGEGTSFIVVDKTKSNKDIKPVIINNVASEPEQEYTVSHVYTPSTSEPIGVKEGRLFSVDMSTLGKVSIRDYYMNNHINDKSFNVCSLIPDSTYIYQIRTKLLEPFVLQWDWICLRHVLNHDTLINGHVYLVDSPKHGKMVKRLEIRADRFVLSLPITRKDYPVCEILKTEKVDFYDIVCKITNNVSAIFNEQIADHHNMAIACMEANKGLIENQKIANENVKLAEGNVKQALSIIENLSKK